MCTKLVLRLWILMVVMFAGSSGLWAQYTTPNINGGIASDEYGNHLGNSNNKSGGWYMTWDAVNLYIAVAGPPNDQPVVIYLDLDPVIPVNGGNNSNGTDVGFNYDGTNFEKLPFRANRVIFAKNTYREYRSADGNNGWSAPEANFGSYAVGVGIREFSISWSALGGMPDSFNFFAYHISTDGVVDNRVPLENPMGSVGTSARFQWYHTVRSTANASPINKPFAHKSYVFNSASNIDNFGSLTCWDMTMNSAGQQIARQNTGGDWNIAGTMRVNAGTVFFGTGGSGYGSTNVNDVAITGTGSLNMDASNKVLLVNGNMEISSSEADALRLSNTIGGDLELKKNFVKTGTGGFVCNNRSVTFSGNEGIQVFESNVAEEINFLYNTKTGGLLNLLADVLVPATGVASFGAGTFTTVGAGKSLSLGDDVDFEILGSGSSVSINGSLINTGNLGANWLSTNGLSILATGLYDHQVTRNGQNLGSIPAATWSAGSNCLISGLENPIAGSGFASGLGQNFRNFTWNTPGLSSPAGLDGSTLNVISTFSMVSTGSAEMTFGADADGTLNCVNYVQSGGSIDLSTGSSQGRILCSGDFNKSGGTLTESGTGSGLVVFDGSAQQDIDYGGTSSQTIHHRFQNPAGYVLSGSIPVNSGAFLSMRSGSFSGSGSIVYAASNSTLLYDGSGPITTSTYEFPGSNGPARLTLNKSGGDVSLHTSRSLPNDASSALTLTAGRLFLGNHDLNLLRPADEVAVTGSNASHVVQNGSGKLYRTLPPGESTALFPLGDGTNYTPFELSLSANSLQRNIWIQDVAAVAPNMFVPNTSPDYLERHFVVNMSPAGGTYDYLVSKLGYTAGDVVGNADNLKVNTFDGSAWLEVATTAGNPLVATEGWTEAEAALPGRAFTGRNSRATYVWNGSVSSSWDEPLNWTPNGFPSPSDEIVVNVPGANLLVITDSKVVRGATLEGTGEIALSGSGSLTVSDALAMEGDAVLNLGDGSSLSIAGSFSHAAPATANFDCNSTVLFTSAAAVEVPALSYGHLVLSGGARTLLNSGTIEVCGDYTGVSPALTTATGSTVRFNGSSSQSILGTATSFSTLEVANSAATVGMAVDVVVSTALTVNAGARLDIATHTLDLTGSVSMVNGFLRSRGTVAGATAASLIFTNGGSYEHNYTNTAGSIPTATWQSGSTCAVIGYTSYASSTVSLGGLGQDFHHFTWDCPGQTGFINLLGTLTTVNGDFTVANTGIRELQYVSNGTPTLSIGGNFTVSDAIFNLSTSSGQPIMRIAGDVDLSNGVLSSSNAFTPLVEFNGTTTQTVDVNGLTAVPDAINFRLNNAEGIHLPEGSNIPIGNLGNLRRTRGALSGAGVISYPGAVTNLRYDGDEDMLSTSIEWPSSGGPLNVFLNHDGALSGSGITLHESRSISSTGIFTLTKGKMSLGDNDLTILNTANGGLAGGSPTAYFAVSGSGKLIRAMGTGTHTYRFPLGVGSNYNAAQFAFTANSVAGRQLGVRVLAETHPNMAPNPTVFLQNLYWETTVDDNSGTYNFTPSFTYNSPSQVSGTPVGLLGVSRWDGVEWTNVSDVTSIPPTLTSPALDEVSGSLDGIDWTGRRRPEPLIYTWDFAGDGSWNTPTNWDPEGIPGPIDEVYFVHAADYVVSDVPVGITMGRAGFLGGGSTTWVMGSSGSLRFGGDNEPVFGVAVNTEVIISGDQDSHIIIESGSTGLVQGTVRLEGLSGTTSHSLQATDAGALHFLNGSYFAAGVLNTTLLSGHPFGDAVGAGTVVFEAGSVLEQFDGEDPFGNNIKVVFESGSLYKYSDNNAAAVPSVSGRVYADFEYNSTQTKQSTGSETFSVEGLRVSQGTFEIAVDANGSISGDVEVAAGATLRFNPPGSDRVVDLDGTVQDINTFGTGVLEVTGSGNGLNVVTGSRVNMIAESAVIGTGRFGLEAGATLGIESADGLAATGLSQGNIQCLTRDFDPEAHYVYQRNGDQATGLGLPALLSGGGSLRIAVGAGNTVTHSQALTGTPLLVLESGIFDNTGHVMEIAGGGTLEAISGDFAPGTGGGTVRFGSGANSAVAADADLNFYDVELSAGTGGVDFGASGNPTVSGTLRIFGGRFVNTHAPLYANGSTLSYQTGGDYGRGVEWNSTTGRGYPHHVSLSDNTVLQPGANGNQNTPMEMGGSLGIHDGAAVFLDWGGLQTTQDLVVPGDVNITGSGQLTLSTVSGDLRLGGNWTRSAAGVFNSQQRAVFTNGNSDQSIAISPSGTETFHYLVNIKPSGNVVLGDDTDLNISGNAGNVLVLSENSAIDLNGRTLRVNSPGGTQIALPANGVATVTGGSGSRFLITAGNKEITSTGAELSFGPEVLLELQSGLDCGVDLSTVEGTLQLSPGGFVDSNGPNYAVGSTLRYATGGPYGRGAEWNALTGAGYPYNVEVNMNGGGTTVDLFNGANVLRRIAGNLTLNDGGTLNMDDMQSRLEVLGNVLIADGGTLNLGNLPGGDIAVAGDFTREENGTLNQNGRELVMNGNAVQTITGVPAIAWLAIENEGSEVRIAQDMAIANRLRLAKGIYNLNGFSNTMADGSEIMREATTAVMSAGPTVNGTDRYDLRYTTASFATGIEFAESETAVRDVRIVGVTTTLGNDRTFNRDLVLESGNLDLGGNTLVARGQAPEPNFSGSIVVSGGGNRTISGPVGSRFDITGLGANNPANFTKTVSSFGMTDLVFGPDVVVRIGDGAVDFGRVGDNFYPTRIQGTLEVLLGGSVGLTLNPCYYEVGSYLRFANGIDFGVTAPSKTWAGGAIDSGEPGVPYNVDVDGTGTDLELFATRAVRNNLRITDGAMMELMSTFDGSLNVGGDWSNYNEAGFIEGTSSVVFDGTGSQVISCPGGEVFYNIGFGNAGAKSLATDLEVKNDLEIQAGSGVLDAGSHDIHISGNWVNDAGQAAFDGGSGAVVFEGEQMQTISSTDAQVFYGFGLSNSNPDRSAGVVLDCDVTVMGPSTFDQGLVHPETFEFGFGPGAPNPAVTGNSYVNGWVYKTGFEDGIDFDFPVGDFVAGSVDVLQQAGLRPEGSSSEARFRLRYYHENHDGAYSNPNNPPPTGPGLLSVSTCNYWDIERLVDGVDARVKLGWTQAGECIDVALPSALRVAHFGGSQWNDQGGTPDFVGPPYLSGYVISDVVDAFSPFAIGSNGPGNALPITLLSFGAEAVDERWVKCEWSTASEVNNDFFAVERSRDGVEWLEVGRVDGAGNSNTVLHYDFADDAPLAGLSYYRLRQTDYDGSSTVSDAEAVYIGSGENGFELLQVYRGSEGLEFRYRADAAYLTVEIYDVGGRLLDGTVHANDSNGNGLLEPNLARGVYLLRLKDNSGNADVMRFFW